MQNGMNHTEKKRLVLVVDDYPKVLRFIEIDLKLRGFEVITTTSGEEASEVAGYRIAFPAFIPEGFERGKNIMVTQLGVPGLTNPANLPRTVEIVWAWIEDDSVKFVLTQSAKKFSVGNTEPAEICGVTGEKGLMEAVPDRMPARLVLGWSDGNLYYSLYGTLAGPLDEEILTQIACSVAVK